MHIEFIGTGAADWTNFDGDEMRLFTSTLFDEKLLVDGTMDIYYKIADKPISDVLFTHSHRDHFSIELLKKIAPVRVHVHSSWAHRVSGDGIEVIPFEAYVPFEAAGMRVTAMHSNHLTEDDAEQTMHFIIESADRAVLYATDGAWLTTRQWRTLRQYSLDAAIFDATIGEGYPGDFRIFEHNSIEMLRIIVRTLKNPMFGKQPAAPHFNPVLKQNAPIFLTHMARTLHPSHGVIERSLHGEFIPAFDGMGVDI